MTFLVTAGLRKDLLADKAEDPAYVEEKGIPVDYEYYFTNQLKKPVCDLLEPLVGNTDIFRPPQKTYKKFTMLDFFKKGEPEGETSV